MPIPKLFECCVAYPSNFFGLLSQNDWLGGKKITGILRSHGIVSLDMSSPPLTIHTECIWGSTLSRFCSLTLPNLRHVKLSNNGFGSKCLYNLTSNYLKLEKITWHNIDRKQSTIDIDGWYMWNATNLREIYMDNSVFCVEDVDERDQLLDLENDEYSNIFLFHKCSSKLLERVSIRNAKWYTCGIRGETVIPQNALIKFVRNAPTSLRWFRSDLTKDNMTILRSERPDIELVN